MSIDKLFALIGEAFFDQRVKKGDLFGESSTLKLKRSKAGYDQVRRKAQKKGRGREEAVSGGDKPLS